MEIAYERGIVVSEWHDRAKRLLDKLPERRRLAVLIAGAKADPRVEGPWAATYDQIAVALGSFARMLGWPSARPLVKPYKDGVALRNAEKFGRAELLLIVKAGIA